MPGVLSTRSAWTINCSQGVKTLEFVKSAKIADAATGEWKNNCSDDFPVGYVDKPGEVTVTFSVFAQQGKPEIDYYALKWANEFFSLTRQLQNGQRWQFGPGRVSKIDADDDDEGGHMFDVELKFARVRIM